MIGPPPFFTFLSETTITNPVFFNHFSYLFLKRPSRSNVPTFRRRATFDAQAFFFVFLYPFPRRFFNARHHAFPPTDTLVRLQLFG